MSIVHRVSQSFFLGWRDQVLVVVQVLRKVVTVLLDRNQVHCQGELVYVQLAVLVN